MPDIKMKLSCCFISDESHNHAKELLEDIKKEFIDKIDDLKEEWDGDKGKFSFLIKGLPVSGIIIAEHTKMEISITLPWQATLFKGKIESVIREKARGKGFLQTKFPY